MENSFVTSVGSSLLVVSLFPPTRCNNPARRRTLRSTFAPMMVIGSLLLLSLTGCQTSRQVRSVTESGFLQDYSQLKKGKGDRAKLIYINPSVNWARYTKIHIDRVELWKSDDPDSKLGKLSAENQQMLVSYLYTALNDQLSKDFQIVDKPGPDTLVLRSAITQASKSKPVLNLVSSIVPFGIVASYAKQIIFGTGLNVGEVQVEMELLDGQTNQRLVAAVDRRSGTKALRTKFDGSWGDVKLSFDYWAKRLQTRLAEERAQAPRKTEL